MKEDTKNKMKISELIELYKQLNSIIGYTDFEFNWWINENIESLRPFFEQAQKQETELGKLIAQFTRERATLMVEYGLDNPANISKVTQTVLSSFENKLKELKEKHKENLDKYEKGWEDIIKGYETKEIEIEITPLVKEFIPKNLLTEHQRLVFKFIHKK